MKAAVLREVGKPLTIETLEIGKPGPHEVLVRTAAAGVCHSDLHFIEGLYPARMPMVTGEFRCGRIDVGGAQFAVREQVRKQQALVEAAHADRVVDDRYVLA